MLRVLDDAMIIGRDADLFLLLPLLDALGHEHPRRPFLKRLKLATANIT
jgi:hypothetical protein